MERGKLSRRSAESVRVREDRVGRRLMPWFMHWFMHAPSVSTSISIISMTSLSGGGEEPVSSS